MSNQAWFLLSATKSEIAGAGSRRRGWIYVIAEEPLTPALSPATRRRCVGTGGAAAGWAALLSFVHCMHRISHLSGSRSRWNCRRRNSQFRGSAARLAPRRVARMRGSVLGGWADGCGGGRLDGFEAEHGGDAAGAKARQLAQDLLELASVGGGDVQKEVVLAGDGVGAEDLGHGCELVSESWVVGVCVLGQGDEHERLDAQADLLVVDDGADAFDDARGAQALDAS